MGKTIRDVFYKNLHNGKKTAIVTMDGKIYPIVSIYSESTYHIIFQPTKDISPKNIHLIQNHISKLVTYESEEWT